MDKKYENYAILFFFLLVLALIIDLTLTKSTTTSTTDSLASKTSPSDSNKASHAKKVADSTKDQSLADSTPIKPNYHPIKGIYLTQWTLENTALLNYLIKHAKAAGIDTFIVDMELPSKKYHDNIALVRANHITYVARIIMFPEGGGKPNEIANPAIWQRKYALVQQAIAWGAASIQLDYIRYSSKEPASSEHAKNVYKIIQWYKNKLAEKNIPLEVDVFGITSLGESKHIGQNVQMFAQSVDAICPMVYPSHFVPFPSHFEHPYDTVYHSLALLQKQFNNKMPIKMYAYIELSNYHYPMTHAKTLEYIKAQIKAAENAGADGWYAWSPHNRYDNLFSILENKELQAE